MTDGESGKARQNTPRIIDQDLHALRNAYLANYRDEGAVLRRLFSFL
jgi:hypothetical protein